MKDVITSHYTMINESLIHKYLSIFILFISPITYYILTRKVVAPFGKHSTTNNNNHKHNKRHTNQWGPSINPKLAWFIFESPNLVWSFYAYYNRNQEIFDIKYYNEEKEEEKFTNVILFSLFVIHYINRCLIYPLRMDKRSSDVNLSILTSAFFFCTINGL